MSKPSSEPRETKTVGATPGHGHTKISSVSAKIDFREGAIDGSRTIVGKKVTLAVVTADGALPSDGKWQIPAEAVAGYACEWAGGHPSASVKRLGEAELTSNPITFYWTSRGPKTVVYRGANPTLTVSRDFDVDAPTVTDARGVITQVVMTKTILNPGRNPAFYYRWLGAGNHEKLRDQWPGIRFVYSVTAPDGGDGQIAGVQRIWRGSVITILGVVHRPLWKPREFWLDDRAPYADPNEVKASEKTFWRAAAKDELGLPGDHRDTPGYPIEGWDKITVDERFQMSLMYRPKGDGNIWVTLKRIDWQWAAEAYFQDGEWTMEDPDGTFWVTSDGTDSHELPEWSRAHTKDGDAWKNDWNPPLP